MDDSADVQTSSPQLESLGNYLAELTLVEYDLLRYLPSMIASSAVFLAKLTLDPTTRPWARLSTGIPFLINCLI
jgi:cyclin A